MNKISARELLIIVLTLSPSFAFAGWSDFLDYFKDKPDSQQLITQLSESDVISGLKEALLKGGESAVNRLGKKDGFFLNPQLKIPMPEKLQIVETMLRKLKQDEMADQFVLSLNRAAESAVPEAMSIFTNIISSMSIEDAHGILQGPDNAATEYLRNKGSNQLQQSFLPIVKEATGRVGVTNYYKRLLDGLGPMSNFIDVESLDLDQYVTTKAIAGLFTLVAREEKLIRENPTARTTAILKKVFSAE